jgi:Tfp pilus assembly protein PilF
MSLLLEALKKAELAKQNASGQQGEPTVPPAEPLGGLSLEPAPGEPVDRTLITRDRLPDITQPLEILSEDLPSAGVRREAPAMPSAAAAAAPAIAAETAAAAEDAERASARQIFEAKTPDYDPRRPFFLVVGALGVVILGILGYFGYQLFAPRPSFYTGPAGGKVAQAPSTPPAAPAAATPAGPAASASPPTAVAPPPAPTVAAAPSRSDAAPTAAPAPASAAAAAPAAAAPTPPQQRPAATGGTRSEASRSPQPRAVAPVEPTETGEARGASAPRPAVRASPAPLRVDPTLEAAWEALQAGDLARARDGYERVLQANPRNRDALLGLATIDARNQNYDAAERRYVRVLELDPKDPYAQAGLVALRGLTDPVHSESRLKNMLAQNPDATFLNFYLGNQYAVQSRWPDAQGAYFRAFSADPENPEYAYNLAVSLDHIGQQKLALEYYRRALALAGNRAVGFNSAQVEARIRELTR